MSQNPQSTLSPEYITNEDLNPSVLIHFAKLWDKYKKQTCEPYDILDDKLRILLIICKILNTKPNQFHALLPRILKSWFQTYYLHFIDPEASFTLVTFKLKAHFDEEINHNTYYTYWTTTNFGKIRQENNEKSLQEVFQILIDKIGLASTHLDLTIP